MKYFVLTRELLVGPLSEILAPQGWASFGRWHREGTNTILKLARSGTAPEVIDNLITDLWHDKSEVFLRNISAPLRRFGKDIDTEFQRLQMQRANLVDEAIACHYDGYYSAAMTLVLAQIDGLTRDITGQTFFSHSENDDYMDDETLAGIASNLPIVREPFRENITSTGFYGRVSRHGAAHGRDLTHGNKVNSTKTLVLMGALIEYLETRAAEVARRRRRKRDRQAQMERGVDENGRLRDDRQLEQLYYFALDLDAYLFSENLMQAESVDEWQQHIFNLLQKKNLSRRNFSWQVLEIGRYSWFYKTPGGQYLGAAAKRFGNEKPVEWKEWRWDSDEAPSGPPWSIGGWAVHDGNNMNTTPNWSAPPFPA